MTLLIYMTFTAGYYTVEDMSMANFKYLVLPGYSVTI